jgi:hypothetical protein
MITLQAIACSHGVEPVKNGTALTSAKATLRAQVYSAMLRASLALLKAAAIENPRLITARYVRCWRAPWKGGAFQWVQVPPGNRSSRKQSEQSWR